MAPKFNIELFKAKRELAAGTPISLECSTTLQSERLVIGQLIPSTATLAVWSDCKMVVAPGAQAMFSVKSIQPATNSEPERLVLQAVSITAVDGSLVPLTGELALQGRYPNESMEVPAGTPLSARVLHSSTIKP